MLSADHDGGRTAVSAVAALAGMRDEGNPSATIPAPALSSASRRLPSGALLAQLRPVGALCGATVAQVAVAAAADGVGSACVATRCPFVRAGRYGSNADQSDAVTPSPGSAAAREHISYDVLVQALSDTVTA